MSISLHPLLDQGALPKVVRFRGGVLTCNCVSNPVKVEVASHIQHVHACGCAKCWRPKGALFSIVAMVASNAVSVFQNKSKLRLSSRKDPVQRFACRACGTHMLAPVADDQPFSGATFIHPERFEDTAWPAPSYAANVSSLIESGVDPGQMKTIRARLHKLGMDTYDCLSPELMDHVASWTYAKQNPPVAAQ